MSSDYPAALLGRLSFVLGKLYFRSIELENRELESLGVDIKQQAVLAVLAEEGAMTQQQLGQRLGIDRTTIVAVVDGLEDKRLVERHRNPQDRRAYLLNLTQTGRRTAQRGQRLVENAQDKLLEALSQADRRALTELLARAMVGR